MTITALAELIRELSGLAKLFPRRTPRPVLVIDDDELWREQVSDMLGGMGYKCKLVRSISAAEAVIEDSHWSLVLLDVAYDSDPLGGLRFFHSIKKRYQGLKIVFLTAYPETVHMKFQSSSKDAMETAVGHLLMIVDKNLGWDAVSHGLKEALELNGAFHPSKDFYKVTLMLCLLAGAIGHFDTQIANLIKLWLGF